MSMTVGYWRLRGLGQSIRLLLTYAGVNFEDKYYDMGPAPEYKCDAWFVEDKHKLSLGEFPNLPYLIDGEVKVTQSNAILRYLGRKYNLDGSTDEEKLRIDMVMEESMDFRNKAMDFWYGENMEQKKAVFMEGLEGRTQKFESFLGDNDWFAGNKITFVDFVMYERLDQHKVYDPSYLTNGPRLTRYLQRFEALPNIKSYLTSDKYIARPINGPMAYFK